jgi:hypothetical protein
VNPGLNRPGVLRCGLWIMFVCAGTQLTEKEKCVTLTRTVCTETTGTAYFDMAELDLFIRRLFCYCKYC